MKLLVVGGGGREHAIIRALKKSPLCTEIWCAPGNGDISYDAHCKAIPATDVDAMVAFAKEEAFDYVVVAQDDPLALGMVDALAAVGIPAFGPDKAAARIEASKVFSKDLMKKYGIPTAKYETFDAPEKVMDYIKAVRTMRTEMNVHPAKKTSMIIETADAAPFQKAQVYLAKFAFATDVTFTEKYEGSTDGMVQVSTHTARGFIPMMELIDRDKELARLNKEKAKAEKELAMFENQLANPKFVERAPAALVEEIRAKRTNSQSKLANIEQSIKALG